MQELLALLMFVLAQFGVGADSTRYIDRLFDGGTVRPSRATASASGSPFRSLTICSITPSTKARWGSPRARISRSTR